MQKIKKQVYRDITIEASAIKPVIIFSKNIMLNFLLLNHELEVWELRLKFFVNLFLEVLRMELN